MRVFVVFPVIGLMLLLCSGMHMVWAIYQVLFFETSEKYQKDANTTNETMPISGFIEKITFLHHAGLMFTIVMWFIGVMLGSFVAGWFLVRVVQKRNIYVSSLQPHLLTHAHII